MNPVTVVLTRQPAQAGTLEQEIAEAGHDIQFLPLTDFELPADLTGLEDAGRALNDGRYQWVLFTSPNSIRALNRAGWNGSIHRTTRAAATGPGTARVLYHYSPSTGYDSVWMPAGDASAHGIMTQFPTAPAGQAGRILLPQSEAAGSAMTRRLRELGWAVEHVLAYRTVRYPAQANRRLLSPQTTGHDDAIQLTVEDLAGSISPVMVVLTSPSSARELAHQRDARGLQLPATVRLIALGQPTRKACQQLGLPLHATAPSPDATGILAVVENRTD